MVREVCPHFTQWERGLRNERISHKLISKLMHDTCANQGGPKVGLLSMSSCIFDLVLSSNDISALNSLSTLPCCGVWYFCCCWCCCCCRWSLPLHLSSCWCWDVICYWGGLWQSLLHATMSPTRYHGYIMELTSYWAFLLLDPNLCVCHHNTCLSHRNGYYSDSGHFMLYSCNSG